jgi:Flp pilus assembly pilin Flp
MYSLTKQRFPYSRRAGQGILEYALIIALIAVITIAILLIFGSAIAKGFQTVVNFFQGSRSTGQIIGDMQARMLSYYNANGRWPRTFSPYNFTDIGLKPSDYSQPINGLYFSPHGSEVGIANRAGDAIEVYAKDPSGRTLHLINGWSIWCPVNNTYCYYHNVAPGNEVLPGSIYATGN